MEKVESFNCERLGHTAMECLTHKFASTVRDYTIWQRIVLAQGYAATVWKWIIMLGNAHIQSTADVVLEKDTLQATAMMHGSGTSL